MGQHAQETTFQQGGDDMKLISYVHGGSKGWGVVVEPDAAGGGIIPADAALMAKYPTIRAVLAAGALAEVSSWATGKKASLKLDAIKYLPPLHDAGKIICIGVNYPKRHPVDGDVPPPKDISLFIKTHDALVGNNEPLEYPKGDAAKTFDYEGELVLVIGKAGRHIAKDKAFDHIAGYTIMNDGSVRGWQKHSVGAGKNFHASGASGPWFTTADEIADPSAMQLTTKLNGEQVQSTTVSKMVFDIPTMIAYVSAFASLQPGDIVSTGSPDGAGGSRVPQRFLVPGDELEISWSGLGTLKNKVVAG
jgi:2-keto-4-pentenoate hydratase/2-oxohepta-3-ene-1,7-dioic acid hydratase in catechol pathway